MTPETVAALVTTVLQVIEQDLLPSLDSSSKVARVLTMLEQVVPLIVQWAEDLAGPVKNIIAALRGSGVITPEQLEQLKVSEAKLDGDFRAAAAAAAAEDAKG